MVYHADDLINVREAANQCGRNAETIRRWIWGGKLPAQKLGNQLFIKKQDLALFCKETAIAYRAEPEVELDAAEIIRRMRAERDKEIEGRLHDNMNIQPGSRSALIKRMRKLRERIRARVGNIETGALLEQLRRERINEF